MMKHFTKNLILLVVIFSLGSTQCQEPDEEIYDVLIQNGSIIDGSGRKAFKADLLIRGEEIVKIGDVDVSKIVVKEIIDAKGKVVSPGFIDSHAHGDPMRTPDFENFLAMGVTTIFLGQDGSSDQNIAEWMRKVEEVKPEINIGTFVGHGSIRNQAGVKINPSPSSSDLVKMSELVEDAIKQGCFGLSTGLEYQPGFFSKMDELVEIAKPVGINNGIIHSHMRNEDDETIDQSIAELIAQGEGSGSAVQVSHIKVVYGHGAKRAQEILDQMEKARNRGVSITADIYPYNASYSGIGLVFPEWAKPPHNYQEVVKLRRADLLDYLNKRVKLRNGPEATLFGTAPWAGKTLAQVAKELNKPFADVLIDDIGPKDASAAYFVMDQELQDQLLIDPHVMICTDGSPTMRHPRAYGSFAKIIRYYVREKSLLSLEEAIHKMTGLPSKTIGLMDQRRGLLKEGFAADVLVFDPEEVNDKATYENPLQLAEGFDWVIVNGEMVLSNGAFTKKAMGKMLRKN